MNKKGQFWSITGLLLILLLLSITQATLSAVQEQENTRVERAQSQTTTQFIETFTELNTPKILEHATKHAVSEEDINRADVQTQVNEHVDTISDAYPFVNELQLEISIQEVNQVTIRTFNVTYQVDTEIATRNVRANTTAQHTISVTPQILYEQPITGDWIETEECIATEYYGAANCNGLPGLIPPE